MTVTIRLTCARAVFLRSRLAWATLSLEVTSPSVTHGKMGGENDHDGIVQLKAGKQVKGNMQAKLCVIHW